MANVDLSTTGGHLTGREIVDFYDLFDKWLGIVRGGLTGAQTEPILVTLDTMRDWVRFIKPQLETILNARPTGARMSDTAAAISLAPQRVGAVTAGGCRIPINDDVPPPKPPPPPNP
jgi:hypothetical protein